MVKRWMLEFDVENQGQDTEEILGARLVPHEFGGWVDGKDYDALQTRYEAAKEAIKSEPEFPGSMPDEMWEAIKGDKDAMREALRITVRLTKKNILAAFERGEGK